MKKALLAAIFLIPALARADSPPPYAGEQHRAIKALSAKEIDDLAAGRGMGLARAAELNGYPGPLHVLELAGKLNLTQEQRMATQALFDAMNADAKRLGGAVLEAERDLDRSFAAGSIDESVLHGKLDALAALQGELRFVHLRAHLAQAALLTVDQRKRYDMLRGYADAPSAAGEHPGPGPHAH